jgi:hypothetical protein
VGQGLHNLIVELAAWCVEDGSTSFTSACRVPPLKHEPFDVAVKDGAIVQVAGTKSQEVVASLGRFVTEELQLQIAHAGVQCNGLKSVGVSCSVGMGMSKGQRTKCGWLERGTQNRNASRIKRTMDEMPVTAWLASDVLGTHAS